MNTDRLYDDRHPDEQEPTQFELAAINVGATLCYPDDRYGYVIVDKTAKTILVRRLSHDARKIGPAKDNCNGFLVFNHKYTEERYRDKDMRGDGSPERAPRPDAASVLLSFNGAAISLSLPPVSSLTQPGDHT